MVFGFDETVDARFVAAKDFALAELVVFEELPFAGGAFDSEHVWVVYACKIDGNLALMLLGPLLLWAALVG